MSSELQRIQRLFEQQAGDYDRGILWMERNLVKDGRQWVCSQARGDVLEIAVGTGRNLPYYPPDVRLTAIDLTPAMLALAHQRAQQLGRDVELRLGNAHALDFPAASFDTIVCVLSLCTIPDPAKAVAEVARVLRPGGQFILLEHVRSPIFPVHVVQWLLDPFMVRFEGDHLIREPLDYVNDAGLHVERLERSGWGIIERVVARKPA